VDPSVATAAGCDRQIRQREMCSAGVAACEGEPYKRDERIHTRARVTTLSNSNHAHALLHRSHVPAVPHSIPSGRLAGRMCGRMLRHPKVLKIPFIPFPFFAPRPAHAFFVGVSRFYLEAPSDFVPDDTCAANEWSRWSECSKTCDKGFRTRTRKFFHRMGRKKCPHVDTVQKELCAGRTVCPQGQDVQEADPRCALTDWSEWSPCSISCGERLLAFNRISSKALLSGCGWRRRRVDPFPGSRWQTDAIRGINWRSQRHQERALLPQISQRQSSRGNRHLEGVGVKLNYIGRVQLKTICVRRPFRLSLPSLTLW